MQVKPTQSGGRIAQGDTPFLKYRVEWDAHGSLISDSCEIRTPEGHNPIRQKATERCQRCGGEMVGSCSRRCKQCGLQLGCGD